ncbi:hypothetical protein KKI23_03045, partial [Patescibacteria group bacterium]|nr:hypothetical protein [Patescibacteria group bacterium]
IEEDKPVIKPEKPPKKPVNKGLVISIVVIIIAIGGGVAWFLTKTESDGSVQETTTNDSTSLLNTNSSTDEEALGDLSSNQYNVPGYSFFKHEEYNFSTIYKAKWIVKEYSEQDLGNGDISKIFAFYSFEDYQSISAGRAPNYKGSVFIEIHKPIWSKFTDIQSSSQSYLLANNQAYNDTENNIIYAEVGDYVYSIDLRGSENTDVYENMLKYFHFLSQTGEME